MSGTRRTGSLLFSLTLAAAFLLSPAPSSASSTVTVSSTSGKPMFEVTFYGQGDTVTFDGDTYGGGYVDEYGCYQDADYPMTWILSGEEQQAVVDALKLWADILADGSVSTYAPAIAVVTSTEDNNASAGANGSDTSLLEALTQNRAAGSEAAALIEIGKCSADWSIANHLSVLPSISNFSGISLDLVSTLFHEMGHALGIISTVQDSGMSTWDSHLYDRYGTALSQSVKIVRVADGETISSPDSSRFYVGINSASGVTFLGENVSEVLNGALGGGILIIGYEERNGQRNSEADLSHIELEHSLMSHQYWRNYTTFMEAELAALQDLGYSIDRRKWYGYSIYNDGLTFTNDNGYFARNADGTAYIDGEPSTATLGVGLHIYGKNNTVTQAADLLADGVAGTGIRVDGSGNTLTIDSGVTVTANGDYGTGLLVSYGKNQHVVSRGTVLATGTDGIAARFDFGNNVAGNYLEYRGSWIWSGHYYQNDPYAIDGSDDQLDQNGFLLNLNGPLVSSFDVSGTLEGSKAAIYISENAYVQAINILSGASIQGDIISLWNPTANEKSDGYSVQYSTATGRSNTELVTALHFGRSTNADGSAGEEADDGFFLAYDGNITGASSLNIYVDGGTLAYGGTASVLSVNVLEGATLSGEGVYALSTISDTITVDGTSITTTVGGTFTNAGTVSPASSSTLGVISISGGTYEQTSTGSLLMNFNASGGTDTLLIDGNAVLAGDLVLSPAQDFYRDDVSFAFSDLVSVTGSIDGSENGRVLLASASPTLGMSLTVTGAGMGTRYDISVTREDDAYSRYADTETGLSVGRALARVVATAEGDMQNLFAALDFSAADGSTVRGALNQLGPEAYDSAARASLAQQSEFNILLLRRMLADWTQRRLNGPAEKAPEAETWTAWAIPYGAGAWQGGSGETSSWHSSGLGLLAGMDRSYDSGLTLGVHVALAARCTDVNGDHDAQAKTMSGFIGAQALLAPQTWDGCWLTGQARIGLESGEMERNISFNGYRRHNESRWTGTAGSALFGGGRDWTIDFADSSLVLGPLGWLEYAFLQRPEITERDGQASRLTVDGTVYESLLLSLGGHVGWSTALENGGSAGVDLLAAWRHELLDGTFRTGASFRGYGGSGFESTSELSGRDAMLLQAGLKARHPAGFTAQLEAGGEFFRQDAAALNVGLSFGWEF